MSASTLPPLAKYGSGNRGTGLAHAIVSRHQMGTRIRNIAPGATPHLAAQVVRRQTDFAAIYARWRRSARAPSESMHQAIARVAAVMRFYRPTRPNMRRYGISGEIVEHLSRTAQILSSHAVGARSVPRMRTIAPSGAMRQTGPRMRLGDRRHRLPLALAHPTKRMLRAPKVDITQRSPIASRRHILRLDEFIPIRTSWRRQSLSGTSALSAGNWIAGRWIESRRIAGGTMAMAAGRIAAKMRLYRFSGLRRRGQPAGEDVNFARISKRLSTIETRIGMRLRRDIPRFRNGDLPLARRGGFHHPDTVLASSARPMKATRQAVPSLILRLGQRQQMSRLGGSFIRVPLPVSLFVGGGRRLLKTHAIGVALLHLGLRPIGQRSGFVGAMALLRRPLARRWLRANLSLVALSSGNSRPSIRQSLRFARTGVTLTGPDTTRSQGSKGATGWSLQDRIARRVTALLPRRLFLRPAFRGRSAAVAPTPYLNLTSIPSVLRMRRLGLGQRRQQHWQYVNTILSAGRGIGLRRTLQGTMPGVVGRAAGMMRLYRVERSAATFRRRETLWKGSRRIDAAATSNAPPVAKDRRTPVWAGSGGTGIPNVRHAGASKAVQQGHRAPAGSASSPKWPQMAVLMAAFRANALRKYLTMALPATAAWNGRLHVIRRTERMLLPGRELRFRNRNSDVTGRPIAQQSGLQQAHPGPAWSERQPDEILAHTVSEPGVQPPGGMERLRSRPGALRDYLRHRGGGGASLDAALRTRLMPHLGFDPLFARLHTGPIAAEAARQLNAEAFTIGSDVFFAAGQFDIASPRGIGLLTHELTHVGQQTRLGGPTLRFFTAQGGDTLEQEAQAAERRAKEMEDVMARAGGGLRSQEVQTPRPTLNFAQPPGLPKAGGAPEPSQTATEGRDATAQPGPAPRMADARAVADRVYELMKQERVHAARFST